jgi:amidohydrolase
MTTKHADNALWAGRLAEKPSDEAFAFQASINVDQRMAEDDMKGSIAHARMLGKQGILNQDEAAALCAELDKMGIPYRKDVGTEGCTGVVALIEGRKPGKVFCLRTDCDGLPIKEETGLPFASTNGCMHACGHDAHAAGGLAAVKIIKDNAAELEGTVKVLFQPGEEGNAVGLGGASRMVEDGCLENPHVDVIMGLHVGQAAMQPGAAGRQAGTFCFRRASALATMDKFEITIRGVGSHGSMPHLSVDTIAIAGQIITAMQNIVSREISPRETAVISFGTVNAGAAWNAIPDECKLSGTTRCYSNELRKFIGTRMEEVATNIAKAMRGSVEFKYSWDGAPPVVNNTPLVDECMKIAEELFPGDSYELPNADLGGEDFAFYLQKVLGFYTWLYTCDPVKYPAYHHNSKFDIDESVLWRDPALMSAMAFEWLSNHK